MQKLFWLFWCYKLHIFFQNYNIRQLLTIGDDYPVPKDKHAVIKILPVSPDPFIIIIIIIIIVLSEVSVHHEHDQEMPLSQTADQTMTP